MSPLDCSVQFGNAFMLGVVAGLAMTVGGLLLGEWWRKRRRAGSLQGESDGQISQD